MSLTREELRINLAHAKTRKRNVGIPIWSNRHKLLQEKASFPFEGGVVELLICRPECYTDVMFISWIQQYVTSGMLRRVIDNPELASLSDKDWNRRPVLLLANWKVTPPNWQPVTKPGYVPLGVPPSTGKARSVLSPLGLSREDRCPRQVSDLESI